MVSTASSGVDRRFERWSSRTKDYTIGIYCFPTRALWSKSKDCLACNQHDVSEWSGMSSRGIVLLS